MQRLTTLRFEPSKLRKAREARGLRQSQAAGLIGIDRRRLYNYEHEEARGRPDPDMLLRLCTLYDIDLRDLGNRRVV